MKSSGSYAYDRHKSSISRIASPNALRPSSSDSCGRQLHADITSSPVRDQVTASQAIDTAMEGIESSRARHVVVFRKVDMYRSIKAKRATIL